MNGNEGCDVYLRESGYMVEHFRINRESTTIVHQDGPYATREEAKAAERKYRESNENGQ